MAATPKGVAVALLLGVAGCTVGPDFVPPAAPGAAYWHDGAARDARSALTRATNPNPAWWNGFNDPVLTDLIRKAIAGNLDLKQAVLRVAEAQQSVATARAAGLPMLNATGSYSRMQVGLRGILKSSGAYSDLDGLADSSASSSVGSATGSGGLGNVLGPVTAPLDIFQYGLSASWELDLFGRVRRSVEQAKAQTAAQAEAANDALIMLESQVAQAYVTLRGAQALQASQNENVRAAQEALDLTARRQRQGLTTELDVEQARTQLADLQRQLPGYEKQTQQAMNRLSVLTGQPPGALDAALATPLPLPPLPPTIGVGVPSSLARRRPDIRQAEKQLHAATANVGVAVANFYPDVSLTGSLGLRAIDASYLTDWASHFYSAGPSISLPIFQGGRLAAGLRMARASEAEAALHYRSTVLNALREVEDALVAYRTDKAARDRLVVLVQSATTSLQLARSRYSNGLSDFLQVLDSERSLFNARQQMVQQDMTLANDVVTLFTALGGGWQDEGTAVTPSPVRTHPPPLPGALDAVVPD